MLAAASEPVAADAISLDEALASIAATAVERDRRARPEFPAGAIELLQAAGALAFNASVGSRRPPASDELALVRSVARADGSVGRIFDGHLNGVERLAVQGPPSLRDAELPAIAAGTLHVGVWGGDPRPGEGAPATIERRGHTERLSGVKTFCSGAGGLHRALVLAHDPQHPGPPVSAWVDLTDADTVQVDDRWYRAAGLRASVSHRVVFGDAPVLARFGPPGAISEQPWFGRDALRTAASWAGMADAALESALAELASRPERGPLQELAAGQMLTVRHTIDAWLAHAAHAMDTAAAELPAIALHARVAIGDACGTLLDTAARACGSHQFATGGELDRARRDLELFVLQHRLGSAVAADGAEALRDREAPA